MPSKIKRPSIFVRASRMIKNTRKSQEKKKKAAYEVNETDSF